MNRRVAMVGVLVAIAGCKVGARVAFHGLEARVPAAPAGLDQVLLGDGQPITPARVALGARLFFDPIVSRDSSLSCASCHQPAFAFGDSVRFSPGVSGHRARRNTPPLVNRAYAGSFFWDGRAASLEQTVLRPIEDPNELDLTIPQLMVRLGATASYRAEFDRAFPGAALTPEVVASALASYVRMLRFGNSAADRFALGDSGALAAAARRGRELFFGHANCSACHAGPTFSDGEFHNTGVGYGGSDTGRLSVTGDTDDRGRFRTPTLRDVTRTAPYMHDGSLTTLDDVVSFYNRGGLANPYIDPQLRPRHLSPGDESDLVAFLRALTSDR